MVLDSQFSTGSGRFATIFFVYFDSFRRIWLPAKRQVPPSVRPAGKGRHEGPKGRRAAPPKTSGKRRTGPYTLHEIMALSLGGVCAMFFLALISYSPADLPAWVPFSSQAGQNHVMENFIGPVGAVTAGYSYFFFGAASFLIPAVLAWWSIQIIGGFRPFTGRNVMSFSVLIVSAACLIEYQDFFLKDWAARYNLPGSAGGLFGYGVGHKMVERALGSAGSLIVVSIAYLIALIVITGIHPLQLVIMVKNRFVEVRKHLGAAGRVTLLPRWFSIFTSPSTRDKQPARGRTVPVARASKKEKPEEMVDAPELPLEMPPAPDRKIIDASQRNRNGGKNGACGNADLFPNGKKSENESMLTGGHFKDYKLPSLSLLKYGEEDETNQTDENALIELQNNIVGTLATFGVDVEPGDITKGPTITRYEVYPTPGLRVNRITSLQADLARATRAEKINILAPVPGKDTVGIEIANSNRVAVALRELFEDSAFRNSKAKLPLALGKDVYGRTIIGDLARMPHLLVAGATGSGKSVCINSIIASLLYRFTPDELRFIMIDPKVVEMQLYNELPHMVVPVVTDSKKVLLALRWLINEMERRYALFAKMGTRNFDGFNSMQSARRQVQGEDDVSGECQASKQAESAELELAAHYVKIGDELEAETGFPSEDGIPGNSTDSATRGTRSGSDNADGEDIPESLPYIVVIIDELADLMQTAPADVESGIGRIAQKARAAGIHLIVATQTPRADVVTGVIKANIPSRVAFQVSSKTDSRIILDENGAENLVGKGDMLYLPPGSAQLIRAQGALITDEEAQSLVEACASQGGPKFETDTHEQIESGSLDGGENDISDADEELMERCLDVVCTEKKASTSLLQRRLRLGYTRAARMIDIMESRGIIGPGDGAKPREILVDLSDKFG